MTTGPKPKLTLDQRMAIRRAVKACTGPKMPLYAQLAKAHGVSESTVTRTVYG